MDTLYLINKNTGFEKINTMVTDNSTVIISDMQEFADSELLEVVLTLLDKNCMIYVIVDKDRGSQNFITYIDAKGAAKLMAQADKVISLL